jgi:predicted phosphodiesterase
MKIRDFIDLLQEMKASAPVLRLEADSRILFISDLHLGDGVAGDDSLRNEPLLADALESYYLPEEWTVVLNGDVEELQKFEHGAVLKAHPRLYACFDALRDSGRLYKLVGNHDLGLLGIKEHPYPILKALRLEHDGGTFLCYHGHQSYKFYSDHPRISNFFVRYFARPLKIRNSGRSMTSQARLRAERRIYLASRTLNVASITGHTHRPLFETLDKRDRLRYEVESLLARHPLADVTERDRIENEIRLSVRELRRISRKRKRKETRSLYDTDGLPVPCLFNSGCATAKGGFTGIEISLGKIALVLWTRPGMARPWVDHEAKVKLELQSPPARRYTLRSEPLSVVFSKIRLLS